MDGRREPRQSKPVVGCLTIGCAGPGLTRGLCPNCYRYLGRQIKAGKTTWEEAEAAGRCAAVSRPARQP
jgi:hypothetical protein